MELYIFDLDGTLTDTLRAIAHFANLALSCHGFGAISTERYKALVGDGMDVLIHRMLGEFGSDTEDNFFKVRKTYDDAYKADFLYDTDAYDGIRPVLDALKASGHKIAVCSNKPEHVVVRIVDAVFGSDYFDAVCAKSEQFPAKPSPDMALDIARRLGTAPENCVFIGDTNVDIRTGKNAGMTTVGVLWGFRGRSELETEGADYIIGVPNEILNIEEM